MKPRGKSPWSPASPQPHDDAHPASTVVSARESRATPSGFPFSFFLHAVPSSPHCPATNKSWLFEPQRTMKILSRGGMLEHRHVDEGRAILARFEPEYEYDLDVDRHNELLPLS